MRGSVIYDVTVLVVVAPDFHELVGRQLGELASLGIAELAHEVGAPVQIEPDVCGRLGRRAHLAQTWQSKQTNVNSETKGFRASIHISRAYRVTFVILTVRGLMYRLIDRIDSGNHVQFKSIETTAGLKFV